MAKDRTAKDPTAKGAAADETGADPGADTEMFRAFVERSQTYEERSASKGPLVVAGVALLIAIVAFALIISLH